MLMMYSLIIAMSTLFIAVLVINKDLTLQVLNNISFKWVFDKSTEETEKKKEGQIQIKDLNKVDISGHFSRYLGIRLARLGAFFLLIVGISWFVADFQLYKIDDQMFFDDPNLGRDLIAMQVVCIAIFSCAMTFIGIKFSNKTYEKKIFEKVLQDQEDASKTNKK